MLATLPATHTLSNLGIREVRIVAKGIEMKKYGYAVNKGNHAVLAAFTDGIARMKQSGRFHQLQKKWLPTFDIDPVMTQYSIPSIPFPPSTTPCGH